MSLGLVRNYADGKLSPDEESFDLFQDVLNQNRRTKCWTEAAVRPIPDGNIFGRRSVNIVVPSFSTRCVIEQRGCLPTTP